MVKKAIYSIIFCILIFQGPLSGMENFRNITTATYGRLKYDQNAVFFEDLFMYRIIPSFTLLAKVYRDERFVWNNSIFGLGGVYGINNTDYIELSYNLGYSSENAVSHLINSEYTRESTRFVTGLNYRFGFNPVSMFHIISPSFRYYIVPEFFLFSKVFLAIDTVSGFSYSVWYEGGYRFLQNLLEASLGGTFGSGNYTYNYVSASSKELGFSVLAGLKYSPWEALSIKYIFEQQFNTNFFLQQSHSLILDIKF